MSDAYALLKKELGTDVVTYGAIHKNFVSTPVPKMVVALIHLTMQPQVNGELPGADIVVDSAMANTLYAEGLAVSTYIDKAHAQEHPLDKRYLLRYLEHLCLRHGTEKQTAIGFGHDIIYSRKPLAAQYKSFDNTQYVPPLTGHWAIVGRPSQR